jgi:hypothetical protein
MNELLGNNYDRLKQQYFCDTDARRAAARISAAKTPVRAGKLGHLLRYHGESRVKKRETWKRDAVDELLHFYGVMEVAALLGLIPKPLPHDLRKMAVEHLSHPAVNKYFVTNYPLVLPQLFLLRALDLLSLTDGSEGASFPEFVQLLQLDAIIHGGDEDIDVFLWFLDGGSRNGYDIDDTIRKFRRAERFFRSLAKQREQMTTADSSVRGCVLFLDFCRELDSFLRSKSISPLLRYESWHLYGYWFSNLQAIVANRVSDMIERAGEWRVEGKAGTREKARSVAELHAVMQRLLSGEYGRLPTRGAKLDRNYPTRV